MTNQRSKCLRLTLSQIICLHCSKQSATLSNILRNSPMLEQLQIFFLIIYYILSIIIYSCVFFQYSGTRFLKSPTMWSPERHHKERNMAIFCTLLQTRLRGQQGKICVASRFKLAIPSVLHIRKILTMYSTEISNYCSTSMSSSHVPWELMLHLIPFNWTDWLCLKTSISTCTKKK